MASCPMPGRPVAGNLLKNRFNEIWNGPVLTSMRLGLINGEPHDCCAHCNQNPKGYDPSDPHTSTPQSYQLPDQVC